MSENALTRQGEGFVLRVRLQPKSSTDRLEGLARDAMGRTYLKARVRAQPEKGKANAALEKLLAKAAGVSRSTVSVVKGNTERVKTVHVTNVDGKTENALRSLLMDNS